MVISIGDVAVVGVLILVVVGMELRRVRRGVMRAKPRLPYDATPHDYTIDE